MITKYSDLRVWDYGGTMKVRDRYTVRRKIENDAVLQQIYREK
jgi:hypothetical protein